jgi:hypothetical protein
MTSFTGRKCYYVNAPNQRRKLMGKAEISQFNGKQIVCVEYENLTNEDEREIFQVR